MSPDEIGEKRNGEVEIAVIGAVDHPLKDDARAGRTNGLLRSAHRLRDVRDGIGAVAEGRHRRDELDLGLGQTIQTDAEKAVVQGFDRFRVRCLDIVLVDLRALRVVPGEGGEFLEKERIALCHVEDGRQRLLGDGRLLIIDRLLDRLRGSLLIECADGRIAEERFCVGFRVAGKTRHLGQSCPNEDNGQPILGQAMKSDDQAG